MRLRIRNVSIVLAALAPFLGVAPGCSQSDNPKMTEAPPPAAPKPEEVEPPKRGGKQIDPTAFPKYQKATSGQEKAGR
jgi:hypothetical protein